jgi:single-strand DNA-binding protein
MNKVILIGNLANDPEAFTTQSGISRSTFRLAVQRKYANAQGVREADFLTIVAWRNAADFANRYLPKGRKVAIEGRIQVRSYEGQDGAKHWVTEIIADSVEAVGGSRKSEDPGPEEPAPRPGDNGEFEEVDDEEVPF